METFRVLIVENDAPFAQAVKDALKARTDVCPEVAGDAVEASNFVRERFYHIAFVDAHLGVSEDIDDFSGFDIIRQIAMQRPQCRRFLMTKFMSKGEYVQRACDFLHPLQRIVDGLIQKQDWKVTLEGIVNREADAFLRHKIRMIGLQPLAESMARPSGKRTMPSERARYGEPEVTLDEIDDVVSRLFGQGSAILSKAGTEDVSAVHLRPLGGGKSSASVTMAQPVLADGRRGVWCVVKVGPIDDCREEYSRFSRFVRYRIGRERRTDMLGYTEGDSISALSMSFVGASPDEQPESLATLFERQDPKAIGFLSSLFSPENKDWYEDGRGSMGIAEYFGREYEWKGIPVILIQIDELIDSLVRDGLGRRVANSVVWEDGHIELPSAVTGLGVFRVGQRTCIVHGDLHGGNIIVDGAGDDLEKSILIDYRHVGVGPRCIDFAALEASVRLACNCRRDAGLCGNYVSAERAIISEAWGSAFSGSVGEARNEYWETVSLAIVRLAIENFEGLTVQEYAAACIMWGLRVISIPNLEPPSKLRMLEWMSEYCQVFRE